VSAYCIYYIESSLYNDFCECWQVRAYRNTASAKQAQQQQNNKLAPLLSAAALRGGRVDLLQQLSSAGAASSSPSKAPAARKAAAPGDAAGKTGARGGKGIKGGAAYGAQTDAEELPVEANTATQGPDVPHRCITNFILMTATGSMVPPDALVSEKAGPLLLLGTLTCEEQEAEEDLARVEHEQAHDPAETLATAAEAAPAPAMTPLAALQASMTSASPPMPRTSGTTAASVLAETAAPVAATGSFGAGPGQLLNLSALQSLMASQKKSLPFQNLLQQHRGPTQVAMVQITQIFCSSSSSSSSKCRASCNSWVLLHSLPWEASQA
jgi:hypothetical protein